MRAIDRLTRVGDVLVVCAHPDDETFGLGGIVATLTAAGATVRLLCLTRGESSSLGAGAGLPARRESELAAAASELGISEVTLGNHPDAGLGDVQVASLAREVEAALGGADLLLAFDPDGITGHPDHVTATRAALAAGEGCGVKVVSWTLPLHVANQLNRELGTGFTGTPTEVVDFALVAERTIQRAAMERHASQLAGNPVPERRLELQGGVDLLRLLHDPDGWQRPVVPALRSTIEAVWGHASSAHPAEICGLVSGRDGYLEEAIPVANIATPPPGACGFHMDPAGQFETMRDLESRGLDVTGVYHSHPATPPVPSAADIRLADPFATQLIVSPGSPCDENRIAAWRIAGGLATRARIATI